MPQPEQQMDWRERLALGVHRMPLVPAAALVMLGIGLSQWTGPANVWLWLTPAAILLIAASALLTLHRRRLAMSLVWFALLWIGAAAHGLQSAPESDDLSRAAARDYQPLVFRAEVIGGAIWRPNSLYRPGQDESERWRTQWRVHCTSVRDGGQWQSVSSFSTLTVAGRIAEFLPGDELTVFGSFAKIREPSNPGQSDLREIFRAEHQFVFLRADTAAQLQIERRSWQRPIARLTAMAVRTIDRAIHRYVPLGQGPLAAALVFGQRQQVDWDAQQQLLSTGTLHMLAISGMHIELVAGALWIVCWVIGLRQRASLLLVATVISLYALIAGANPPVLRAVFVVLAVCVARWRGRRSGLANLLAFSGLAVLALRASWIGNVGVQLSFLAVATIAIFARTSGRAQRRTALAAVIEESWTWRERMLRQLGRWSWQMTVLSFWVWLFTAPLIWSNFHVVSLVAIPLNIVLWPLLVVGLLSGLVLAVTWWLPPVNWLMGLVCGVCLWGIGGVVWLGDRLPLGHMWLPAPSIAWITIFYAIAAVGIAIIYFRPWFRKWLGGSLVLWMLLGMLPWFIGPRGHGPDWLRHATRVLTQSSGWRAIESWLVATPVSATPVDELRLTFIDVGHGTSVLIEVPSADLQSGEVWLYDAGHLGGGERSHQEIANVLWSLPTARIDHMFVSHADADHYNALPGLVERFSFGEVASTPQFWQHPAEELGELRGLLHARRVMAARLVAGEVVDASPVQVQVLHPPGDFLAPTDNANSLTLLVRYAGKSCLLPGDLEKSGMERLLSLPGIDCDVLMAPHHGSTTQDPRPIIKWCQPEWIVISGGPRAAKPKVIELYSPSGVHSLVTHLDGAIQCRISSDGTVSVWCWQEGQWHSEKQP